MNFELGVGITYEGIEMRGADMIVKRGDVFYADLRPVVGSEQGGDPSGGHHSE